MKNGENQEGITKTQYRAGMGAIALASGAITAYEALNYNVFAIPQAFVTALPVRSLVKSFLDKDFFERGVFLE